MIPGEQNCVFERLGSTDKIVCLPFNPICRPNICLVLSMQSWTMPDGTPFMRVDNVLVLEPVGCMTYAESN